VKDGVTIHEERLVAGKVTNQTPIFSDQMETIVFNPYWYPPKSIVQNEILPGARRNAGYVARIGLQVSTASGRQINPAYVDWYTARPGQVFFRQPPGPGNVLGEIKFLFPNKHQVYLHDTPSKHLFKREVRAYSHGCMRVQNPRKLAEVILNNEAGWSKGRIAGTIATGENTKVALTKKIPIHISYFTAWIDEDDKIRYANDIYGHDRKVWAAFAGEAIPRDPADPVALAQQRRARAGQYQPQSLQSLFSIVFGTN
jgi:murein L,D-transpeptidase YcbB/YkuD